MAERVTPPVPEQDPYLDGVSFKVSARAVRMLGRENVSNQYIAVMELVKNCYDADAKRVTLTLDRDAQGNQRLIVADDGCGMDMPTVVGKWLWVGTNHKEQASRSPGKRVYVGSKGIGRLAMDRLGRSVKLETRAKNSDTTIVVDIDWDRYDHGNADVSSVRHPARRHGDWNYGGKHGTVLTLTRLRDPWSAEQIKELRRDLSLLIPPGHRIKGFAVRLEAPDYPELTGDLVGTVDTLAEVKVHAELSAAGISEVRIEHDDGSSRTYREPWKDIIDSKDDRASPSCGPLEAHLFFLRRSAARLKELDYNQSAVRKVLDDMMGVRLYRDSFRVKPYGEPGGSGDWLELNLRKVQSPAGVTQRFGDWRVGENQLVGSVLITRQENPLLEDKTNREGLVSNAAFNDMRAYVRSVVRVLELERQRHEMERKEKEPEAPGPPSRQVRASAEVIRSAAQSAKKSGQKENAKKLEKAAATLVTVQEKAEALQSENQVLMGLASLGIALATFGHETQDSVSLIGGQARLLQDTLGKVPATVRDAASDHIALLRKHAQVIQNWGAFALDHVRRDKRKMTKTNVERAIKETMAYFQPTFDKLAVKVSYSFNEVPDFRLFRMDLEAVIINLTTNAVEALKKRPADQRKIQVGARRFGLEGFAIEYQDSGEGVLNRVRHNLFEPLVTTKLNQKGEEIGTGLGLTIVRRVAVEYGGRAYLAEKSDLGGAKFVVEFKAERDS